MQEESPASKAPLATHCNEDTTSHQSPSKRKTRIQSQLKKDSSSSPASLTPRVTRSQAAPDWTVEEVLILLGEIANVDDVWLKEVSSYQRWKMVSDNCAVMNVVRSSNQCKRKWEMLLDGYTKIVEWEPQTKEDSYWCLPEERREHYGLPVSFQKELFDAVNAVIQVQQQQSDSNTNDPWFPDPSQTVVFDAEDTTILVQQQQYDFNNSDSGLQVSVPAFETSSVITGSETPTQQYRPLTFYEEEFVTTLKIPDVGQPSLKNLEKALVLIGDERITPCSKSSEELNRVSDRLEAGEGNRADDGLIVASMNLEERPKVQELFTASKIHKKPIVMPVIKEPKPAIEVPKPSIKRHSMAAKLRENAEHVCAILQGGLHDCGGTHGSPFSVDPLRPGPDETELARRRADDLIQAIEGLTDALDELCQKISGRQCAGIPPADSMACS